jgi:hypothetical protein
LEDIFKGNSMGSVLVDNFIFDYPIGSIFKSLVVVFFANNVGNATEDALFVVD